MRIIGIDPGLAIVGYGVIDAQGRQVKLVDYGTVTTPAHTPMPDRLNIIYQGIYQIVKTYQPDAVAMEELFFNTNVTTAIAVGQARGVTIMAARNAFSGGIFEYTPMQVKQALTGYGHADKAQIQQMVKMLLKLKEIPKPDDAADALAIAICQANSPVLSAQFAMR